MVDQPLWGSVDLMHLCKLIWRCWSAIDKLWLVCNVKQCKELVACLDSNRFLVGGGSPFLYISVASIFTIKPFKMSGLKYIAYWCNCHQ